MFAEQQCWKYGCLAVAINLFTRGPFTRRHKNYSCPQRDPIAVTELTWGENKIKTSLCRSDVFWSHLYSWILLWVKRSTCLVLRKDDWLQNTDAPVHQPTASLRLSWTLIISIPLLHFVSLWNVMFCSHYSNQTKPFVGGSLKSTFMCVLTCSPIRYVRNRLCTCCPIQATASKLVITEAKYCEEQRSRYSQHSQFSSLRL